jgi:hypothetical protein
MTPEEENNKLMNQNKFEHIALYVMVALMAVGVGVLYFLSHNNNN